MKMMFGQHGGKRVCLRGRGEKPVKNFHIVYFPNPSNRSKILPYSMKFAGYWNLHRLLLKSKVRKCHRTKTTQPLKVFYHYYYYLKFLSSSSLLLLTIIVISEVLCILSTLKPISQKKSINLSSSSFKQSIHYREEIFYLTSYGSHQSLLLFYVRHNEIKKALSYLLDHQLEPNFFLDNIMLPAYRLNLHEKFKSNLLSLDSSLESFKVRACACASIFLNFDGGK